jgi:hypothetical protein
MLVFRSKWQDVGLGSFCVRMSTRERVCVDVAWHAIRNSRSFYTSLHQQGFTNEGLTEGNRSYSVCEYYIRLYIPHENLAWNVDMAVWPFDIDQGSEAKAVILILTRD